MKKNKLLQNFSIFFSIIFILFNTIIIANVSHAAGEMTEQEIRNTLYDTSVLTSSQAQTMLSKGGNAFWLVQAAGIVTGVCVIAYTGFKYIISSPDGKADLKDKAPLYVIGAFLIMSAATVVRIVGDIAFSTL